MYDSCCAGGYEDRGGVLRSVGDVVMPFVVDGRKPPVFGPPAGVPGADETRPPPLLAFLFAERSVAARCSGTRRHNMPFPGSSGRRGTLSNAGFRERLCLIEFY